MKREMIKYLSNSKHFNNVRHLNNSKKGENV